MRPTARLFARAIAVSLGIAQPLACAPMPDGSGVATTHPKKQPTDPGEEAEGEEGSSGASGSLPAGSSSGATSSSGGVTPLPLQTFGFPAKWIDGSNCQSEPRIQVWKYTETTFILRQSMCTTFEGPFLYLLVGRTKALLVDTGAGNVDLRSAVASALVGKNVQLVVAHSHAHGDHVGGDAAFRNVAGTTVVGTQAASAKQFFGIVGDAPGSFDLGERTIDVVAIPGHQSAHLAFYDRETKVLLTGDTLYPGRLYIDDWSAYRASVSKLVAFVDAGRPVSFVLGGHIELPKTGADYANGSTVHANERALELRDADLRELDRAVKTMGATPRREVHATFILSP